MPPLCSTSSMPARSVHYSTWGMDGPFQTVPARGKQEVFQGRFARLLRSTVAPRKPMPVSGKFYACCTRDTLLKGKLSRGLGGRPSRQSPSHASHHVGCDRARHPPPAGRPLRCGGGHIPADDRPRPGKPDPSPMPRPGTSAHRRIRRRMAGVRVALGPVRRRAAGLPHAQMAGGRTGRQGYLRSWRTGLWRQHPVHPLCAHGGAKRRSGRHRLAARPEASSIHRRRHRGHRRAQRADSALRDPYPLGQLASRLADTAGDHPRGRPLFEGGKQPCRSVETALLTQ